MDRVKRNVFFKKILSKPPSVRHSLIPFFLSARGLVSIRDLFYIFVSNSLNSQVNIKCCLMVPELYQILDHKTQIYYEDLYSNVQLCPTKKKTTGD
jgi:hypothetical protein